ncbi:MAG: DNA repair protein RadC [Cytophagales bacterium]
MSEEKYKDNYLKILQWAEEDRPREKLLLKSKAALSDAELLAIIIGSGSRDETAVDLCKRILREVGNDLAELAKLSVKDLEKFKGVGEAKAISIIAALELGRRRKDSLSPKRDKITCSRDIYEAVYPNLLDSNYEEFWVVLLNRQNQIIKKVQVSKGTISGTVVDARLVFKPALEHLASSVILVHNHPSGNIKPSQEDIKVTQKLKEAGTIFDIPVLDHIIFTNDNYYSFADEGVL